MFDPLVREAGWADRLLAVVAHHRAQPFAWGQYDCATLFAEAVQAVTGCHVLAAYMPYDSERGALEMLASSGQRHMLDWCRYRFPEIPVSMARRGDLVFPEKIGRLACPAVVLGSDAVSRDEKSWLCMPTGLMITAFKVG
jgi:hypothetical protein